MADDPTSPTESGWRLRLLRCAFGVHGPDTSQKTFAAQLGLGYTTYNNYETGRRRIPARPAIKIARRLPGVTEAYILSDNRDTLSVRALRRLEEAEEMLLTTESAGKTGNCA